MTSSLPPYPPVMMLFVDGPDAGSVEWADGPSRMGVWRPDGVTYIGEIASMVGPDLVVREYHHLAEPV